MQPWTDTAADNCTHRVFNDVCTVASPTFAHALQWKHCVQLLNAERLDTVTQAGEVVLVKAAHASTHQQGIAIRLL